DRPLVAGDVDYQSHPRADGEVRLEPVAIGCPRPAVVEADSRRQGYPGEQSPLVLQKESRAIAQIKHFSIGRAVALVTAQRLAVVGIVQSVFQVAPALVCVFEVSGLMKGSAVSKVLVLYPNLCSVLAEPSAAQSDLWINLDRVPFPEAHVGIGVVPGGIVIAVD